MSGPITVLRPPVKGYVPFASTVTAGGRNIVIQLPPVVGTVIAQGGPVTVNRAPVVGSVLAGNSNGVPAISGPELILPQITAETRQFANDDLDNGTPDGARRADSYIRQNVENGTFNQSDIDKGNAVQPKAVDNTPTPSRTPTPSDCSSYENNFSLSTLIGTSTTLGNFIRDYPALASCKINAVPEQCGLKPHEIVCNLSNLCRNIWEPLKAQYPSALITNSLRVGNNIGAGPHGTGQSMDVQFSGMTPTEYFAVAQWVKNNLPYNQLILEYHTARGPLVAWLHIGIYAGSGTQVSGVNRLLTMMNHRIKTTGLSNLAT